MRRFLFILAVFCTTVLWMVVQKPLFLLFYHTQAAQSSFGEWLGVMWHGLTLDSTVAGYVTAFPVLIVLFSLWIPLSRRVWRIILTVYFALISLFAATIFAVDLGLYGYWGFRLDGSVLIYLSDKILHYEIFAAYLYDDRHLLESFDFEDEDVFEAYLNRIFSIRDMNSFIDTDMEVTAEDKIITLSTCYSNESNQRYLVQAVLVSIDE